jgi:hemerythrin-like metal-binding protein
MSSILPLSGIQQIDDQHKQLVECLDELEQWIGKGHGFAATLDAFGKLTHYVEAHFRDEEDILRQRGYAKLDEHIEEHHLISAELAKLYQHVLDGGDVTEALLRLVRDWVVTHIGVEDMEYADFFGTRAAHASI